MRVQTSVWISAIVFSRNVCVKSLWIQFCQHHKVDEKKCSLLNVINFKKQTKKNNKKTKCAPTYTQNNESVVWCKAYKSAPYIKAQVQEQYETAEAETFVISIVMKVYYGMTWCLLVSSCIVTLKRHCKI